MTQLGLTYSGKEAEEFLQNQHQVFTPEQIKFFKEAKRIYNENKYKF